MHITIIITMRMTYAQGFIGQVCIYRSSSVRGSIVVNMKCPYTPHLPFVIVIVIIIIIIIVVIVVITFSSPLSSLTFFLSFSVGQIGLCEAYFGCDV